MGRSSLRKLTGAAKRLVAGKRHDWVSHTGGVQDLMKHLRSCLGKPLVSDLTEHLNRYFKNSRRRANESMNDYITRKCEVYLRACQALQRVTPHHGDKGSQTDRSENAGGNSRRTSWDSNASTGGPETGTEVQAAAPVPSIPEDEEELQPDMEENDQWWRHPSWWTTSPWWGTRYGGYSGSWYTSWEWSSPARHTSASEARPPVPELIPDFVQGWYLLQDSGLDQAERNVILWAETSPCSESPKSSGTSLPDPRPTVDVRAARVDSGERLQMGRRMPKSMTWRSPSSTRISTRRTRHGAEEEAQGALAIEQAKRTLRAARTRQHNVRMARQYYRPQQGRGTGGMGRGRGPGQRDDSQMTCLRCGKLGHRIANCPQPAQSAKVTEPVAATSSFICYNDLEQDTAYVTGLTTAEAVKKGMAVIDGGATRTLASVPAMEAIMSINHQKHGHNGVSTVDLVDRPVFGFGNGSENQCSSTVHLKIAANASPGSLKVHCLDQGSGPLLLSVESLRKLGAIVDFAEDMICFRSLDAQKIVQVERSTTGHQLLSMTEDIMTRAKAARVAVPSLREYLAETARDSSSGLSFPQKNRRVP